MSKNKKDKKEKNVANPVTEIHLDIPEDEIWTYKIEGLAAPHINKKWNHFSLKVAVFVVTIVIAVMLSMYFSFLAVIDTNVAFEYKPLSDGTVQFTKFSNNGYIKDLTIDCEAAVNKIEGDRNPETNFTIDKIENARPITSIREYAFNCDEKVEIIRIGKEVTEIDAKSFYTCRALKQIIVDEENPNYCDIDGVLYNKDKTELICVPMNRITLLRERYGYNDVIWPDNVWDDGVILDNYDFFSRFKADCMTYVVPASVKKIGKLAFSEAQIAALYLPEGLEEIGNLGLFRCGRLEDIFSYESSTAGDETGFEAIDKLSGIYYSLPDGLKSIGTDAMSYNKECKYLRIPSSVTFIGHNAFYDTCSEDNGVFYGYDKVYYAGTEDELSKIELGATWQPTYDGLFFDIKVDIIYGTEKRYLENEPVLTDKDGKNELTTYINADKKTELKIDESLGENITSISHYAFKWDTYIEEVYIGKDVESLQGRAFYNLRALKRITVDKDNPNYCDIDGVLYSKDKTTLLCYPAAYENESKLYIVPSSVTTLERSAFMDCKLETIYFPEGLKVIGDQAFLLARDLKEIYSYKLDIRDSMSTVIENSQIGDDSVKELEDVYPSLPEGLEEIGTDGFNYASALSYVYIPSSLKTMKGYAFCYNVYINEDGNKEGLNSIAVAASESEFNAISPGGHWIPEYRNEANETADVQYGAQRKD